MPASLDSLALVSMLFTHSSARCHAVTFPTLLFLTLLEGCSAGLIVWPVGQSHHLLAETTITPVGRTTGTSNHFDFTLSGLPNHLYPQMTEEAVREAIEAKGGDILVNYTVSIRVTQVPVFLIASASFWWIRCTAEGMAAKTEALASEGLQSDVRTSAK